MDREAFSTYPISSSRSPSYVWRDERGGGRDGVREEHRVCYIQ